MNIKFPVNHSLRYIYISLFSMLIILLLVWPTSMATAAGGSPFVGSWRLIDVDGILMRLTIAGGPEGPFEITWTKNFFGYCNGEAGIIHGTGWVNEKDSNQLDADFHLECFTTGATYDFQATLTYDPATDSLISGPSAWRRPNVSISR